MCLHLFVTNESQIFVSILLLPNPQVLLKTLEEVSKRLGPNTP